MGACRDSIQTVPGIPFRSIGWHRADALPVTNANDEEINEPRSLDGVSGVWPFNFALVALRAVIVAIPEIATYLPKFMK